MNYEFTWENTRTMQYDERGQYCRSLKELKSVPLRGKEISLCITDMQGIPLSPVRKVQVTHKPGNERVQIYYPDTDKKCEVNSQMFFGDTASKAYLGKRGTSKAITEACNVKLLPGSSPATSKQFIIDTLAFTDNLDSRALEAIYRTVQAERTRCALQGGTNNV